MLCRLVVAVVVISLSGAVAWGGEFKGGAKQAGKGIGEMGHAAWTAVKKTAKSTGHAFKKAGKSTGRAFKKGGKETGQAFKKSGIETGHAFKQSGKETGAAFRGM